MKEQTTVIEVIEDTPIATQESVKIKNLTTIISPGN